MEEIFKKLRFKANGIILNLPLNLVEDFKNFEFKVNFENERKSENSLIFVKNNEDLYFFLNNQLEKIESDSILWIAYPKKTSKLKTDINRDTIWNSALKFGIDAVSIISIDETWSAIRFRPTEKVGK